MQWKRVGGILGLRETGDRELAHRLFDQSSGNPDLAAFE